MKPMGLNSTPFLTYHEIKVKDIDIIDDAWGFYTDFYDVISVLRQLEPVAGSLLTKRLIEKIRKKD